MEKKKADASEMYRMSPTLQVDEELLADIPNANISSNADRDERPEEQEMPETPEEPESPEEQDEESKEQEEASLPQEEGQEEVQETQWVRQQVRIAKDQDPQSRPDQTNDEDQSGKPVQGGDTPAASDHGDTEDDKKDDNDLPALREQEKPDQQTTPTPTPVPTVQPENTPDVTPGPSDDPESRNYFETNLTNGMSVREAGFMLEVTRTDAGMTAGLVSQTVTVNGIPYLFDEVDRTSITFDSGENTVAVTLRFAGNITQTKTYTVFYIPQGEYLLKVYRADTGEEIVDGSTILTHEENFSVRVYAPVGTPSVRLNMDEIKMDESGTVPLSLHEDDNSFTAAVGSGMNGIRFSCTFRYDPGEFRLTFIDRSGQINDRISAENLGQEFSHTYPSESTEFAFRLNSWSNTEQGGVQAVRVTDRNGETDVTSQKGADGFTTIQLDASNNNGNGTVITVEYTDAEGSSYTGRWTILYERAGSTPADKLPTLTTCNLADGEILTASPFVLQISGCDFRSNSLYANGNVPGTDKNQIEVYLNGERLAMAGQGNDRGQDPVYEYYLNLAEGANELNIVLTDNEQYSYSSTRNVYYDPAGGKIRVSIRVDASEVGLGTLITETVEVDAGKMVSEVLEERLTAYGYSPIHVGEGETYYLKGISRDGLLNGWQVSEDRQLELTELGYTFHEPDDMNTLDDGSFTNRCGWMIKQNDNLINMTMGTRTIRDGDMLDLYYVLAG
ncbi:MAG: hypothetical protein Q4B22_00465 [Eubacteriales bacterium]|nr:hypothetical protein [Eubacteriales bacterium]